MLFFQFSQKDKDINVLSKRLVKNELLYLLYTVKLKFNPNYIGGKFKGRLTEENLRNLILCAVRKRNKDILLCFLELAYEDSISEENFNLLFTNPFEKQKETILITLSHKKLSENQLLYLCDSEVSFEAFFELAILYYTSKSFECGFFYNFLVRIETSKFDYLKHEFLIELKGIKPSDEKKLEILKKWEIQNLSVDG